VTLEYSFIYFFLEGKHRIGVQFVQDIRTPTVTYIEKTVETHSVWHGTSEGMGFTSINSSIGSPSAVPNRFVPLFDLLVLCHFFQL